MAHMIEQMAYVGDKPWHGLGSELDDNASIDQWRVAAGLDWTAEQAAMFYRNATKKDAQGKGELMQAESRVIYRSDTGAELGICSDRYKVVQPAEILEFFRDLTEGNGMKMETAGSLEGGKRIWALAKTGDEFRLMGQDTVKGYTLLATSFDLSMATQAMFTATRVVCNNTLAIALGKDGKNAIRVPHSTEFDGTKIKLDMGLVHSSWTEFQTGAEALAERHVTPREQVDFILALMSTEAELRDPESISSRKRNVVADILARAQGKALGSNFRAAQGTAWGLVNAVTEYVDHTQGHNTETRFKSAQFGAGATLKSKAWTGALALVA